MLRPSVVLVHCNNIQLPPLTITRRLLLYGRALKTVKNAVNHPLLSHRRSTSLSKLGSLLTLLVNSLGKKLRVLIGSILGGLGTPPLECDSVSLVLHSLRSNKTLDLGSLGVWLSALLLRLNLSSDDEFSEPLLASVPAHHPLCDIPDIILLGQTKEFSDLSGSLGTKSLWVDNVGETWDILLALLDDGQSKDREILSNNAATNGLSLSLAGSSRSVAGVAVGQEESDTGWEHLQ